MTTEQAKKLDEVTEKVNQIHSVLFGVEGHGGLHSKVEMLESNQIEMMEFKYKWLGAGAVLAVVGSIVGSKIGALILK